MLASFDKNGTMVTRYSRCSTSRCLFTSDIPMQVDTFHTFHWGNPGSDGVWRGNHENVADVRRLLAESAKRQGIQFPSNI